MNEGWKRAPTILVGHLELELLDILSENVARLPSKDQISGKLVSTVDDILRLVAGARVEDLGVRDGGAGQRDELAEKRELEGRTEVHR